jgi:rare lipoprotein A (peptidoglycan hydrolase)
MANGQRFLPESMTCASFDYPLGTVLVVSYLDRSATVTVTDRGPARHLGRLIDLSSGAFEELAPLAIGTVTVTVRVKGRAP